ncbi:C4-type zinc ribbon domain-containing protein [Candidatus Haliotispira prima]|uniref:C4-type zinc ribbon domain-containing protein n=1 Tax=Candidatus Haliotispira prima TaxID=3034016 RepID=A0ABY8MH58_9SPIO|nr:C4-type zinc ribbon domain-containing protein [Candidatus Haliotispira prima]
MKEVFTKLQDLQNVLSNKYQLESELLEIPRSLKMKEESLSRQKKKFIDLNGDYELNQHGIAQLRNDFGHIEQLRLEAEQRMDQIKTQREYEALDKEISEYSSRELDMRRKIQNQESKGQELSEQLKSEEDAFSMLEAEIVDERLRIESLLEKKRNEISDLENEEVNIAPDMDKEMLYKFDRILRSKGGKGIVPISQGICSGCFMILPRQFMNDVRSSDDVHFCPYCSRILFYDEAAASGERVGTGVLDYDSSYRDDVEGLTDLVDDSDFEDFE